MMMTSSQSTPISLAWPQGTPTVDHILKYCHNCVAWLMRRGSLDKTALQHRTTPCYSEPVAFQMSSPSQLRSSRISLPIDCPAHWVDSIPTPWSSPNPLLGALLLSSGIWWLLKEKTQPQGGGSTQWALFGWCFGSILVYWEVPCSRRPYRSCGMGWGGATTRKGKKTRNLPGDRWDLGIQRSLVPR